MQLEQADSAMDVFQLLRCYSNDAVAAILVGTCSTVHRTYAIWNRLTAAVWRLLCCAHKT